MPKAKIEINPASGLDKISFEPSARTLAAWDSALALAGEENGAMINIFEPIGEQWDGSGITPQKIYDELSAIGNQPLTVLINSPGGNIFDGFSIYNLLAAHPAPVTVKIIGVAASAAAFIAMAADEIIIMSNATMMIHNSQWVCFGDKSAMQNAYETMAILDKSQIGMFAQKTGKPDAEIAAMLDAETWFSAEEALQNGFVDKVNDENPERIFSENGSPAKAAARLDLALAKAQMPRSERRALLKEFKQESASKPSAAHSVMPRADEGQSALASLQIAAMKLSLTGR